ncbi:MAG: hypothetical protein HZB50_04050 [Chloroflexi bacterium]|nr:hypothetical protein [Chloroflexota bacterium]
MFKKLVPVFIALAILIAACSPQSTPTMSPTDVQSTYVAAAWTIVAMTQSAIPTNTPTETPTATPLPTFTPVPPSPTLETTPTLLPTSTVNSADCWKPLVASSGAAKTKLRIQNATTGDVVLTIFLNQTVFGDCGYTGHSVGKGESITLVDYPQGCYSFSAFITTNNGSTKSFGGGCTSNPDQWEVWVGSEVITLNSP